MTHTYRVRKWMPERHNQPCRIVARAVGPGPRNLLIEFADHRRAVVPRWSVRRRRSCHAANEPTQLPTTL